MLAVEGGTSPRELTVLLVEDEVLTRLMLADELRSQGLQVLEASNADEALTVLQSSLPVHLLFTDIRMPGEMDGVALAKFAHARFPGIKSIIGSSGQPEIDRRLCRRFPRQALRPARTGRAGPKIIGRVGL